MKKLTIEHRQKISQSLIGNNRRAGCKNTEQHRKRISECNSGENHPLYGKGHTEESKKKISDSRKGKYSGENHPWFGRKHSEETKKKMSDSRKGKYSCENHPNWKGGITYNPYCELWNNDLKSFIKEIDNHQCMNPYCKGKSKRLCIHHIDYDKLNCDTDNLVCVCNSCNCRANFNREYHQALYELITSYRHFCYKNDLEIKPKYILDVIEDIKWPI